MPQYSTIFGYLFVGLLVALWFCRKPRHGRNLVGRWRKYDCCLSCGDSFYWKKPSSIPFTVETIWKVTVDIGKVRKIRKPMTRSLKICQECLATPDKLDVYRIVGRLRKRNWENEHIERAEKAVRKHIFKHQA